MKAASFFSLRIRLLDLGIAGGATLSAATVLGFFGRFWWFLDLFSHFRVQFFIGLTALAMGLLFPRRYLAAATFGLFALANLCTIAPLCFGTEPEPAVIGRRCRAVLMNVNTETGDPRRVARLIQEQNPDILVLEEINDRWLSVLGTALSPYRYSKTAPREDNFGIGLFSKFPFSHCEIQEIGEAEVPSIIAQLDLPDGRLTVVATHPVPPGGPENSRRRNEQLAQLPAIVRSAGSPVLLLGDLNVTPWCYHFKRLLSESGLHDASQGRGVLPTWPTFLPLALIPIDHCLYTTGVHVSRKSIGPKIGSDHYPVIVEFALTKQGPGSSPPVADGASKPQHGGDSNQQTFPHL